MYDAMYDFDVFFSYKVHNFSDAIQGWTFLLDASIKSVSSFCAPVTIQLVLFLSQAFSPLGYVRATLLLKEITPLKSSQGKSKENALRTPG
jgi:hypothetical protein